MSSHLSWVQFINIVIMDMGIPILTIYWTYKSFNTLSNDVDFLELLGYRNFQILPYFTSKAPQPLKMMNISD